MCFGGFSESVASSSSERQSTDDDVAILPVENLPEPEPAPVEPEPIPEPAPAPQPEPEPAPVEPEPIPEPAPVAELLEAVTLMTGRAHTLELDTSSPVAAIEVLSDPEFGNATVNPDNSLAVVLTGTSEVGTMSFDYKVTYADGTEETVTQPLNVVPGVQDEGWATGANHYMLETDEDGDLVIETGDNHRMVHVSGSDDALSLDDIAALEGLDVADITGKWLAENSDYGASPNMALAEDAGGLLWNQVSGRTTADNSNWLLFERGYSYEDFGRLVPRGATGEDELHPIHITAYGDGDRPVLNSGLIYQDTVENVVISGLHFDEGFTSLSGTNIIMADVTMNGELNIQGYFSNDATFTLYDSAIYDAALDAPKDGGDNWTGSDRIQGLYAAGMEGLLIKESLFDHNGWAEGYSEDRSASSPQAPNFYNHNVYIQNDNLDVTFNDNISMRSASIGIQLRPGGFMEDNVLLDNNIALNTLGGDYKGAGPIGQYSQLSDNLITSAGYKEVDAFQGALWWGLDNQGRLTTLQDNIVTHLSDPNNPEEQAQKVEGWWGLASGHDPYYDDTIVYNWVGSEREELQDNIDQNIEGLDTDVLDQTTIQNYTAILLGQPDATIDDLAGLLRTQDGGLSGSDISADDIIAYFQENFGILDETRNVAQEIRFAPDDAGDGVRWDNRLNWSTEDLPGTVDADSVDLAGNWVQYGGTTYLMDFDLGSGGKLFVSHGKLTVEGETKSGEDGASIDISEAGQVWINGYVDTDLLEVDLHGGRFANTGEFNGQASINVMDGQALLATGGASTTLEDGDELRIVGDDADVGFDGVDAGTAVLRVAEDGILTFAADDGELGSITEFRSGAFGDESDVQSGVNLQDGTLRILLDETSGVGVETLIEVDEIIGTLGHLEVAGLSDTMDARVTVDYGTDQVMLSLSAGGTGQVVYDEIATTDDATAAADLWAALTDGIDIPDDSPPPEVIIEENWADVA